ncbi:MAG: acylphosphatase [Thermoleophilaceae bacterium]
MKAVRVLVSGGVQGVGFRFALQHEADRLGVGGWARNLADGRVEALFEGEPGAVAAAVEFAGRGPDSARVDSLAASDVEAEGLAGFRIR